MIRYKGLFLVLPKKGLVLRNVNYQEINNILEYRIGTQVVIVPRLNSDYFILFGSIRLIICRNGSALSHLAILGREYDIPIFIPEKIPHKIPKSGKLSISENTLVFL